MLLLFTLGMVSILLGMPTTSRYCVLLLIVLDIVSKVSIYRNIERWIYCIERVLPSIPWRPRVFYENTERKLPCINISIVSINVFFCSSASYRTRFRYRHRIELDSDIGIVLNSIQTSVSYRTRFRCRYRIELDSDIGIVSNSIPISVSYRTRFR